jgi:protein adenylyltransferase
VLADFVISGYFSHLQGVTDQYARFFAEVVERTAKLIARWQAVAWAHGVMNTDNMSILGLTLDYGPFGFMDDYDAGFICNHSDHNGRYAFNQQPSIGLWNLSCLAQALLPLSDKDALKAGLDLYTPVFEREYRALMRAKFGLTEERGEDDELIRDFLGLLQASHADYTIVFREMGSFSSAAGTKNEQWREHFLNRERFDEWALRYQERLRSEGNRDDERREVMNRVNPRYVLRNYLAQVAIDKAQQKDFSEIDRLLALLQHPYTDQPAMERYAAPPPHWGKHLAVSCSS